MEPTYHVYVVTTRTLQKENHHSVDQTGGQELQKFLREIYPDKYNICCGLYVGRLNRSPHDDQDYKLDQQSLTTFCSYEFSVEY